jgi:hypothetical protein
MWLKHEMHTRLTVKQIAAFIGYHFSSGKAGQLESCWFGRFLYRLPGVFHWKPENHPHDSTGKLYASLPSDAPACLCCEGASR